MLTSRYAGRAAYVAAILSSPQKQVQLNQYYGSLISNPSGVRNLAELIIFNDVHKDLEEPPGFEDQSE